jgi:hypothetical protein
MTIRTTADRWGAGRRKHITSTVMLMAAVALVSCGSDRSEAVVDAAADTTAPPATAETTSAPTTLSTPESTAPAALDETPDCLVGSWAIDSPAWVANAAAVSGESIRHVSGRYLYEFSVDGTYTVTVEAFTIEIDGEEGTVRVESVGTEEGRWNITTLTTEELPHLNLESTAVSVSETAFIGGRRAELGTVDENQGIEGLGPIDCSSNTLLIRAIAPIALDVPFLRL